MASSYLPEKTYVVCNNQASMEYRELLADSDIRAVSIYYKDKRALLTKVDKKLCSDFTCKTAWSKGLSRSAFVGGVGVGLGIAIASASVPVIGWIVGGAIAIGAIAMAVYEISNAPKCSEALGNSVSQWSIYHQNVKFNQHNAILSCSVLFCGEGGVLMPFVSKTMAEKTAKSIGRMNIADISINLVVSGLSGYAVGSLQGVKEFFMFVAGIGIGKMIIEPSADWVGEQYGYLQGNDRYDKIAKSRIEPSSQEDILDDIMKSSNPAEDIKDIKNNSAQIIQAMKANGESQQAIRNFEAAINSAKTTGSFGENNKVAQEVLSNIKQGKYGEQIKSNFTNTKGNSRGMHTQSNYDKSINQNTQSIRANRWKSLTESRKGAMTILSILQPFVSSIFDKQTLIMAIEQQETMEEQNAKNSISVISTNY